VTGEIRGGDKKRAAYRGLVDRVLTGTGRASAERRAQAFGNDGLPPPLDGLVGNVAARPAEVTAADFGAAKAAGCSEDELFELVVCAAVGQSERMYDAGLRALAEASGAGSASGAAGGGAAGGGAADGGAADGGPDSAP